jgi:hypothetical protein
MASLKNFASKMIVLADKVEKNAEKLVKEVASKSLANVVYDTPVDTGRARANWIVNIGSSSNYSTITQDKIGYTAVGKGNAIIEKYKSGDVIYITNNVDYIVKLDNGWSKRWQPESGYVERSIKAGIYSVKMSVLEK